MLRTIAISCALLMSVFTHDASASSRWITHIEKDEMTGTEERYPMSTQTVSGVKLEIAMICSRDTLNIDGIPHYSLEVVVTTENGNLATYFGFATDVRFDTGDGNVQEANLIRSLKFPNKYSSAFPASEFPETPSNASKLRLELELESGMKHIVHGDKILGSYIANCRASEVTAQKTLSENPAVEAEQSTRRELLIQYIAAIGAKIESNWVRPPSARDGLECQVDVTQISGGQVVAVTISRCNGDNSVRSSIEAAVYSASPLPMPTDPSLFERKLQLVFKPTD